MKCSLSRVVICVLATAGLSAEAMPLGVRTMMHARAAVRQVEKEPVPVPTPEVWTLGDAVGADALSASLPWATGGDAAWAIDYMTSRDGVASVRSGAIGAAADGGRTNTTLTATVVGEGSGWFWWKVNCEDMDEEYDEWYDYAVFAIDGVEVAKIAGDSGWTQVVYAVTGAGTHTLAWTFSRDDYDEDGAAWTNAAWVDEFTWTPTPVTVTFAGGGASEGEAPEAVTKYEGYALALPGAGTLSNGAYVFMGWSDGETTWAAGATYVFGFSNVTLTAVWEFHVWTVGEAVDSSGITFTTGGDADWTVDTASGYTNAVSAKSGTVANGQESWIETTVDGAGTLTFSWNVMGGIHRNNPFAYAKVEVDGVQQAQEHSTDGWKEQTVAVDGTGTHVIRWTYLRTSSRTAEGDCAWLDAVTWTPAAAFPAIVDNSEIAAALNGAADETSLAAHITTKSEYDAFRSWMDGKGLAHAVVKDAPNAWLSYALDAPGLMAKTMTLTSEDVVIESFEPSSSAAGALELVVNIADAEIGEGARLAEALGIEGAANLNESAFSSEGLSVTLERTAGGKAKATVTPAGTPSAFFLRVKVK